jgi:hypothetical protein
MTGTGIAPRTPLLSDLPARRAVADPVPAFLAISTRCATRCDPAFTVPAFGANKNTPVEALHVGIDAAALGFKTTTGTEWLADLPAHAVSIVPRARRCPANPLALRSRRHTSRRLNNSR